MDAADQDDAGGPIGMNCFLKLPVIGNNLATDQFDERIMGGNYGRCNAKRLPKLHPGWRFEKLQIL